MKAIKIILAVIAAFVVVLLGVGIFVKEIHYEATTEIDAPLEHTFAVFNDSTLLREWLTGYVKMENVSGEMNEVGSKWLMTFDSQGQEMEMMETVTGFKENELFSFVLESDMLNAEAAYVFSAIDSTKTRIETSNVYRGNSVFARSFMKLMQSGIEQQEMANQVKLKALVERTYSPS